MLSPMTRPQQHADPEDLHLFTEREMSDLLAIPIQTLRNHRSRRCGLPFVRFGQAVRYGRADVVTYIRANAVGTSDTEGL